MNSSEPGGKTSASAMTARPCAAACVVEKTKLTASVSTSIPVTPVMTEISDQPVPAGVA